MGKANAVRAAAAAALVLAASATAPGTAHAARLGRGMLSPLEAVTPTVDVLGAEERPALYPADVPALDFDQPFAAMIERDALGTPAPKGGAKGKGAVQPQAEEQAGGASAQKAVENAVKGAVKAAVDQEKQEALTEKAVEAAVQNAVKSAGGSGSKQAKPLPMQKAPVGDAPLGAYPSQTTDHQMHTGHMPKHANSMGGTGKSAGCVTWSDESSSGESSSGEECGKQPAEHAKKHTAAPIIHEPAPLPTPKTPKGMHPVTTVQIKIHPDGIGQIGAGPAAGGESSAAQAAGGEAIKAAMGTIKEMIKSAAADLKKGGESSESSAGGHKASAEHSAEHSAESSAAASEESGSEESSEASGSEESSESSAGGASESSGATASSGSASQSTQPAAGGSGVTVVTHAGGVKVVHQHGEKSTTTHIIHGAAPEAGGGDAKDDNGAADAARMAAQAEKDAKEAMKQVAEAEKMTAAATNAAMNQHAAVSAHARPGATVTTTSVHHG